jgi:hypothetical protein
VIGVLILTAIALRSPDQRAALPEQAVDLAGEQTRASTRAVRDPIGEDPPTHASREAVPGRSRPDEESDIITVTTVLAGTDTPMAAMPIHVLASDPARLPIDLSGRRPDAVTDGQGTSTLVVPSAPSFVCAHGRGFYGRIVLSDARSHTRPREAHYTIEVEHDSCLEVMVLHPDGRPAEDVELYLGLVGGHELRKVWYRQRSGADGRARFRHAGVLRRSARHEVGTSEVRVAAIGLGYLALSDPLPEPMRGDLLREVVVPDLAPLRVLLVPDHRSTSIPDDCIVEVREHSESQAWLGYVGEARTTAAADGTRVADFRVVVGRSFDARCRLGGVTTTLLDARGPDSSTELREITLRIDRPHVRISWPLDGSAGNTVRASLRDAGGRTIWIGSAERRFGVCGIDIGEDAAPRGAIVELLILDAHAGEVGRARWAWSGRDERVDLELGERSTLTEVEIVSSQGAPIENCAISFVGKGESGEAVHTITPAGSGRYAIASVAPLTGTLKVKHQGFRSREVALPSVHPIRVTLEPARGAELILRGFTGSDLSVLTVSLRSSESGSEILRPSMTRFGVGGDVIVNFADLPVDRVLATIATRDGGKTTTWVGFHETEGMLRAVIDLAR